MALDDRLCRDSVTRSTSYFVSLRDAFSPTPYAVGSGCCGAAAAMLDPEVTSPAQLPLLLSNFMPLPQTQEIPARQMGVMRGLLGICGEDGGGQVDAQSTRVPIIPWPGVEAVMESFKNYIKGIKKCRDHRILI